MGVPQRIGRIQWGDLVMGPGTGYSISDISGIDDLPEIRNTDIAKSDAHGDYTGPDYTGPRTVQLSLTLLADTPDQLRRMILDLRRATQPGQMPADLQLLDWGISVSGKIRKRSVPYDAAYLWRTSAAAIEWYCADPYLYGLDEQSASTSAYSPSAGRTYPLVYGLSAITLNANPDFETALTPWSGKGGATLTRVNTQAQAGAWSAQITPDGVTALPRAEGEMIPVTGGASYRATAYMKCGSARVLSLGVNWFDGSGTYLDTSSTTLTVTAGTWTLLDATVRAPAGATTGQLAPTIAGTPPASDPAWVDEARLQQMIPTWSRSYGSAGASGSITATNNGDATAYPVLRLDGPVANPSIEQTTTGALLVLDATLQAGDYLLIDTRSRAVLFQGTSPRRTWVRAGSTWPVLLPGDNQITYRGSALPGAPGQTSLLTVTWRDTSL